MDAPAIISLLAVIVSLATVGVVQLKRGRPQTARNNGDRDSFTDSLLGKFHSAGVGDE